MTSLRDFLDDLRDTGGLKPVTPVGRGLFGFERWVNRTWPVRLLRWLIDHVPERN
jgi:hypothetical protein